MIDKNVTVQRIPIINTITAQYTPEDFITKDNKEFHPEISKFLALLAADSYNRVAVKINEEDIDADNINYTDY